MPYIEIIRKILERGERYYIGVPIDSITENSRIIDDLAMDSIQIMDLLVDVEDEFQITFDFEKIDAENILTIGSIIKLIVELVEGEK